MSSKFSKKNSDASDGYKKKSVQNNEKYSKKSLTYDKPTTSLLCFKKTIIIVGSRILNRKHEKNMGY